MRKLFKQTGILVLAIVFIGALSACDATRNASNAQKGAVIGTASGAVLGAILGNNVGSGNNSEIGAVIGGVVGGTAGVLIGNRMDKQAQKIEEEIPGAQVERIDDAIVITFDEGSGVYFATNRHDLNEQSRSNLDKLSGVMKEYVDTDILVVGHTDSTGPYDFNMTLSKNRAQSVTSYLVGKGISSGRFTTEWFGPDNPTHDNSTAEGRAKNRRVNVAIVPNEKMIQDAKNEAGEN